MPAFAVSTGPDEGSMLGFLPEGESLVFGTGVKADFILSDRSLAREHFELLRRPGQILVQEIGGETRVGGGRAGTEVVLEPGAMIRAGASLFVLTVRDPVLEEGPLTGRKLGGYELRERVGAGGMGEVYRARQLELDRLVAMKILADELTSDAEYIERFLKEARAAGALNHPNVVQVHDVGEEEGVYYYSMEFIHGGTVLDIVRRKGRLCPADALNVVTQAARALEFAEKGGIVHCDIKPDNLMLTVTGQVRLADLGIAKRIGEDIPEDPDSGVFGSPYYMSPEQARGYEVDNRTDIYSLGATFYRLLGGRPPFLGKEARDIMEKQAFGELRSLNELDQTLPEVLVSVVEKMMRKERGERYRSAAELLRDLERAREHVRRRHEPGVPSRPNVVAVKRKRAFSSLGAAIAACAFLAGVLAGMVWPGAWGETPELVLLEIERALDEGRLAEAEELIQSAPAASPEEERRLEEAQEELVRRKAEGPELDKVQKIASSRKEGPELIRSLRELASTCVSPAAAAEAERLAAAAETERERRAETAFRKALARADVFACELDPDGAREILRDFVRSAPDTLAAGTAELHLAGLDERVQGYRAEARDDESALAPAPAARRERKPRRDPEQIIARSFALARLYMFDEAQVLLRSAQQRLRREWNELDASRLERGLEELSRSAALKEILLDAIRRGALRDTSVELAGLRGWAVSATEEQVVLKLRGGEEARVEWKALPVAVFAGLFLSTDATKEDLASLARLCERSGLAGEARKALLRARKRRKVEAASAAAAREEELALVAEFVRDKLAREEFHAAEGLLASAELRFGRAAAAGLRREVENAAARKAQEDSSLEELNRLRREIPVYLSARARASAKRYAELAELVTAGDVLLAAGEFASARAQYGRTAATPDGFSGRVLARLAVAWALDMDDPSAPERAREFARRGTEKDPAFSREIALGALRLAARRDALKPRLKLLLRAREEDILDGTRTEMLVEFLRSALPLGRLLRVELEFLRARFPNSPLVADGRCEAYILEHDWRLRDHAAVLEGLREFRARPGRDLPSECQPVLWEAESLFFLGERAEAAELYGKYAEGGGGEFARSGTLEKRLGACEGH